MAQSDGHDSPGLIDELVPRHTAVVDEIVVRFEDAVRQPVVTQELPDVFDRIELGTFRGTLLAGHRRRFHDQRFCRLLRHLTRKLATTNLDIAMDVREAVELLQAKAGVTAAEAYAIASAWASTSAWRRQ